MPACQEPSDQHWREGRTQDWQVTWAQTRAAEEEVVGRELHDVQVRGGSDSLSTLGEQLG